MKQIRVLQLTFRIDEIAQLGKLYYVSEIDITMRDKKTNPNAITKRAVINRFRSYHFEWMITNKANSNFSIFSRPKSSQEIYIQSRE